MSNIPSSLPSSLDASVPANTFQNFPYQKPGDFDHTQKHLAIRFTHSSSEQLKLYKQFITNYAVPTLLVLENADTEVNRDHTHAILQTTITINTFRKQLKKKFPEISGNKDFSLTQVEDPIAMFRYVAKGKVDTPPNVLFSSYNEQTVAREYLVYWKHNAELKKKGKESVKPVKCKSPTWMERVCDECNEKITLESMDDEKGIIALTELVLVLLGKAKKKISTKILYELVFGIANHILTLNPTSAHREWSRNMGQRIFFDIKESLFRN